MIKHYTQLSDTVKNTVWIIMALVLTTYLLLLMSSVRRAQAHTASATLTATAQVTAVPTPLIPTVIQHNTASITRALPPDAQIQTHQTSAHTIRVTIIY